jgi:phosphoribosyl-AMP cyclohydrolase
MQTTAVFVPSSVVLNNSSTVRFTNVSSNIASTNKKKESTHKNKERQESWEPWEELGDISKIIGIICACLFGAALIVIYKEEFTALVACLCLTPWCCCICAALAYKEFKHGTRVDACTESNTTDGDLV